MNKYERHKGIIKFMVGDDEFEMRPSIDDWVGLFKTVEGKTKEDMNVFSKEEMESLVDIMTNAIARCDKETPIDCIKEFVESNFMICMDAFTKIMGKNTDMKDLVKKRMDQFGKDNNPTIKG